MKYLFVITLIWIATPLMSQSGIYSTAKEYYRVNPFEGSFSGFITALATDTALLYKQILKQTDTTGYYLSGQYKIFNPFSINANKVDVLLYENRVKAREKAVLSFYVYQLTAYFTDNELNRKIIKKDYKKIVRKLRNDFVQNEFQSLKGYENIEDGEIMTFAYNDNIIKPATISWQTLTQSKQLAFTIMLRLIQEKNYAYPIAY